MPYLFCFKTRTAVTNVNLLISAINISLVSQQKGQSVPESHVSPDRLFCIVTVQKRDRRPFPKSDCNNSHFCQSIFQRISLKLFWNVLVMLYAVALKCQVLCVILHPVLRQNTRLEWVALLGQKWQELSKYLSQSLFPLPDPWMSGLVAGTTVGEELIH